MAENIKKVVSMGPQAYLKFLEEQEEKRESGPGWSVQLSMFYPAKNSCMKVNITKFMERQDGEEDFLCMKGMQEFQLEKDEKIHKFGLIGKHQDYLSEFDNEDYSSMKLITSGCVIVAFLYSNEGNLMNCFCIPIYDLENTETITIKRNFKYEETVLPFPENHFGLIGIAFYKEGNINLAYVGGIYIKPQFASSYEKRK